jgi:hypothetical protein
MFRKEKEFSNRWQLFLLFIGEFELSKIVYSRTTILVIT